MRGPKRNPTNDVIEEFRIYYNFIRPHIALNERTPAEVAGIDLQLGQNK